MTHLPIIKTPTGSSMLLDLAISANFLPQLFAPFCPESRVLITQMQVWYQTKGFFMLYKNDAALLYEKL